MSSYETGVPADEGTSSGDLKERAVDTVAEVDAGAMYVAGVAGEEVGHVAQDVKSAARGFFDETKMQLADQASTQQRRAAQALRGTGDELMGLASGTTTGSGGMATSAVRSLGQQTRRAADWLEQREPADVVREVRGFARRHTGAFVMIALGVGIVAGRLTKALMSDAQRANGGSARGTAGARPMVTAGGMGATAGGMGATGGAGTMGTPGAMGTPGSMGTTGSMGAAGTGEAAGAGMGDTPIGDTLSDERGLSADETASGEWSPSGEAQR